MRLINTTTFQFKDDCLPDDHQYAILSHTWIKEKDQKDLGKDVDYQTYLDMQKEPLGLHTDSPSFALNKILGSCAVAKDRGIEWLWADTCCIDKRSSAEVSKSINSMFSWYQQAKEC